MLLIISESLCGVLKIHLRSATGSTSAALAASEISGTWLRVTSPMIACVVAVRVAPMITATLSSSISLRVTCTDCASSLWLS